MKKNRSYQYKFPLCGIMADLLSREYRKLKGEREHSKRSFLSYQLVFLRTNPPGKISKNTKKKAFEKAKRRREKKCSHTGEQVTPTSRNYYTSLSVLSV